MDYFYWSLVGLEQAVRLDVACASLVQEETRSQVKARISWVKVNGSVVKLSKKVQNGDTIELQLRSNKPKFISLFDYPLPILYEDSNIIVAYKPSGMVTHPAGGHYTKTLVNALEYYRRYKSPYHDDFAQRERSFSEQAMRRCIVHRLDKDTSGIILTARNDKAKDFYVDAFKRKKIKKYYIAVLDRHLPQSRGWIKTGIQRSKHNRQIFIATDVSKGKYAVTKYRVLFTFGKFSLVLFRIYTGRTHQIRVHAKVLGAHIVGDCLYSKDRKNTLLLHAYKLIVPMQMGEPLVVKTGLPKRFKTLIKRHRM